MARLQRTFEKPPAGERGVMPTPNTFDCQESRRLSSVRRLPSLRWRGRSLRPRSRRRSGARSAFGGVAIALLSACYVHTRAHMIAPVITRPSLCPESVTFFDAPTELSEPYVEVARLSVWWPADMIAHVSTVETAIQKKAAQLGANGLIRGRLVGSDTVQPRYEGDVAGVAIFRPRDSARAAAACGSP